MTYEEFQKLDHAALAAKGQAIYREKIRPLVHPQHKGRMLVMDIESGDYEIDDREIVASERLWERRPDAITLSIRVGYKAAYSRGGRRMPDDAEC